MIGKGKSISHGVAALEYDLAKEIDGQAAATEIARHELYGCTGAEMVQEMKPYFTDFPNVKNNCLRFEVSPSIEESSSFTLEKNGYIRRDPTKPRAIEIIDDNFNLTRREVVNVPILGNVAAGQPLLAVENIEIGRAHV